MTGGPLIGAVEGQVVQFGILGLETRETKVCIVRVHPASISLKLTSVWILWERMVGIRPDLAIVGHCCADHGGVVGGVVFVGVGVVVVHVGCCRGSMMDKTCRVDIWQSWAFSRHMWLSSSDTKSTKGTKGRVPQTSIAIM